VSETYATQDSLAAANSAITQNANAISSEVTARETTDSNVSTLSTKVTQNADNITTEIRDRESAVSAVDAKAVAAQSTADAASQPNLFPPSLTSNDGKAILVINGTASVSGDTITLTATDADMRLGEAALSGSAYSSDHHGWLIPVDASSTYDLIIYGNDSINKNFVSEFDANKTALGYKQVYGAFTTQATTAYITIRVGYGSATVGTAYSFRVGLYKGTYTGAFKPYVTPASTLSTLIRESSSGVDVGKSSNGSAYSTSVARVGSDGAFHILTSALVEVAKYAGNLVELGKNSASAVIKFCGGLGEMGLLKDAETTFSPSFGLHSDAKPITLLYSHTVADSDFESGSHTAGSFPTGTKIDSSFAAGQANDYAGGESAIMSSAVAPDGKHRAWGSVGILSGFSDSTGTANPSTLAPYMSVFGGTSGGSTTSYFGGEYPLDRVGTAIQPVVLYNGGAARSYDTAPGSGTTGTVPLSETAANFSKLTIWGSYGGMQAETTMVDPNNHACTLQLFVPNGWPATMVYIKSSRLDVSGTHITNGGWAAMWLSASTTHFDATSAPEISIIRVEGVR
jgi:hypothetical protein